MTSMRNLQLISIIFLFPFLQNAQVSIGTEIPQAKFQVHDTLEAVSIILSTGSMTDQGLHLFQDVNKNSSIFSSDGNLTLKGGKLGPLGGEIRLFETGNVGIGRGLTASDVTNELSIYGNNPLRLVGLNEDPGLDTVLVRNKNGIVFERPFFKLLDDYSYWRKNSNFLFSETDSIGIGLVEPKAPLHVVSNEPLDVLLTSDDEKAELHFQANGVEAVVGQYDLTTSATFFDGDLSAKGISYFQGNFESISGDQTEGMVLHVENEKPIYFGTAGQERMRINGDGNITIGTYNTVNEQLLNVRGNAFFTDSVQVGDPWSGLHNNAGDLSIRASEQLKLVASQSKSVDIIVEETGDPIAIFDLDSENLTIGSSVGDEKLNVEGNILLEDSLYIGTSDYRILLNEDTLSIESRKHMKFGTDFVGDFSFFNRDSAFVHFDGSRASVGIGVKNAIQELEVNGDVLIYDTLYVGSRFNKLYSGANMHIDAITNLNLNTRTNYDIEIRSNGSEYATFEAENKRFGVGTTTPEEKVDVIGTVKADLFKMTTSPASGHVLTSDSDGLASWKAVPNDGDWSISGSDIYAGTSGTVTIGSSGVPSAKLNVKGSISMPIITNALLTYSPSANDYTIIMTMPGSSILLPDPSGSQGRIYVLKFQTSAACSIQSIGTGASVEGMPSFPVPTSPIGGIYTTIIVQSDGISGWWVINY